jgi:hypothetical protein
MEKRRQVRRVVLTEVACLLALLRKNAKWSTAGRTKQTSLVGTRDGFD